jgi:hypothetical protein
LNGGVAHREPARTTTRPIRIRKIRVAGLLLVMAAIAAALADQLLGSSPSASSSTLAAPVHFLRGENRGALGEAGGAVPDGTTVFDDQVPGVAKLDPALLGALRQAATDAAGDGVKFVVNSGWRSPAYEDQLRSEAIA